MWHWNGLCGTVMACEAPEFIVYQTNGLCLSRMGFKVTEWFTHSYICAIRVL